MAELGAHFKFDSNDIRSKASVMFKGFKYRITVLSESLIRFEYSESGIFEDRPTEFAINRNFEVPMMGVTQDNRYLVITTKYFKLEYTKEKPFAGPTLAKDMYLKVNLLGTDKTWYYNHPEARNYLGVTSKLTDSISNNPFNKGLYSTDGFCSINDSESMIINDDGYMQKRDKNEIDIYLFIYKRDFGACLKDYFKLTGKPALIRRSSLGIWWNKDEKYTLDELKDLIGKFNYYDIPLSNILLGNYWNKKDLSNPNNTRTGYTFNKEIFSSPVELTSYLHDRGIQLGLTIDPSDGILPTESIYSEIKKEVKLEPNQVIRFNIFDKYIINTFLNRLLEPLKNMGVDFFFVDFLNQNLEHTRALNYYMFNDYNKSEKRRGMVFSYNGLKVSHRYPIYYSGRTKVDWSTLRYLPYFNSRSSNIGLSWWSHDIGGFEDGVEDPELFMRYVQLGTFSPIFRFASKKGKYYKREPWKWDVKTLGIVKNYCNLRQRLIPYIYNEGYKYSKTGLPLSQPLYYKYPELYDEPIYKNEYFFGSELLVAPITTSKDSLMNRVVHKVFIPNGMWYDFKTGKKFPGGNRYVTFFEDEDYPVFAKTGSIVPLAIFDKNKNETKPPKGMEIHVFPGLNNNYKLYEDDGETNLYKDGYYIITSIDYNYLPNNYSLIIRPIEGKSGIIPNKRDYKIRFRNTKEADDVEVMLEDSKIPFKSYIDDADFVVEVNEVLTTKQLTINCKGKDIEIDAVRFVNEEIDKVISDLQISTNMKEKIATIIFGKDEIRKKRILVRKLKKDGLDAVYVRIFLKLLEYAEEI